MSSCWVPRSPLHVHRLCGKEKARVKNPVTSMSQRRALDAAPQKKHDAVTIRSCTVGKRGRSPVPPIHETRQDFREDQDMTIFKPSTLLLAGIASLAMIPGVAQAQSTDAAAPAATPDDANTVVVTAQRRSENNLNVPVAVSVLKPEALNDFHAAGSDTLLSLSGKVPSLY